jgi:hypothetical protein
MDIRLLIFNVVTVVFVSFSYLTDALLCADWCHVWLSRIHVIHLRNFSSAKAICAYFFRLAFLFALLARIDFDRVMMISRIVFEIFDEICLTALGDFDSLVCHRII